jgi:hypothetical protein
MANKRANAGKNRMAGYRDAAVRKVKPSPANESSEYYRGYRAGQKSLASKHKDSGRPTNRRATAAKKRTR